MPTITRRFEFDAGHRVLGHEGRCRHIHGHRYVAEVTVRAAALDHLGRVVDFSVIKEKVGKWIDDNWDHNILLHIDDPLVCLYGVPDLLLSHTVGGLRARNVFDGKAPFIMPGNQNPTAECMARVLFDITHQLLQTMTTVGVRLYETPNCWSDYPDK